MNIDEWTAQISGQVETLVLAYAALAVTHPDASKALLLLRSMMKATTKEANDSPTQRAYKTGTATAISQLSAAVELARKTLALDKKGKH